MEENFVYPVVVKESDGEFEIDVVDFENCCTFADKREDIIKMAQEVIALNIIDHIDRNKELPKPSDNVENALYIHVWLPYFKTAIKEVYVKKTLTMPQWLDLLAKNSGINYSAALVRGVKEELGLK